MTPQEKLLKLFKVAHNEGWVNKTKDYSEHAQQFFWQTAKLTFNGKTILIKGSYGKPNDTIKIYSLNDLILNWEDNEVSFIDCLSKASQKINGSIGSFPNSVRHQWIMLPTSKRIDFLLNTFEHLITCV